MDPNSVFCPNPDCPSCGQTGRGNIGVHSQSERRYICHLMADCGLQIADGEAVAELLGYRVPPPPWTPPKRRGRRSAALKRLIARWCPSFTV